MHATPTSRWLKFWSDGMYARTVTNMSTRRGNFLAMVTDMHPGYLEVSGWPEDEGSHSCGVMPLLVPSQV